MIDAEHVIWTCERLSAEGIPVWLTGGWGIDALLGEQTRGHKDLDILVQLDDVRRMRGLLARDGYGLKALWPENTCVIGSGGEEIPTAFVLWDGLGHELDFHALRLGQQGEGIPAWSNDEGLILYAEDLNAEGVVAGHAVRCISPGMQVMCHQGYSLPAEQWHDLQRLCERYSLAMPAKHLPE